MSLARVIEATRDVLRHDPAGTWLTRYVDAPDRESAIQSALQDVRASGWLVGEVASAVLQTESGLYRVELGVSDHKRPGPVPGRHV